ncbi:fumarylacetoacetate hydrolase family protein [Shewanella sp. Isolate11]|uniref:fumarylacetoacetate hydrolase family protein n=1 Tax=Shewanella sp. Isolate11 TaxID=2908530 RepID=UPI001EFCE5AD|nr:fumarylacetoacetate hydrolase family protein [Shewanella sp. Isolate11]MCG9697035.1 fumarylacetoacetate hydrolase family protein [Shewanella sp. Isolate11]
MNLQQVSCIDGQGISSLVAPSKVVCVGRNYVEHISELNNEVPQQMVLFVKPNSAISSQLNSFHHEPLHYEAELCFMVKQGKFHGVGVGLDLTKRQLQSELKAKGLPWERAKSFDGSALFSEFVEIKGDLSELSFSLHINGQKRQFGNVDLMINKPDDIYREISEFMTLIDGDIVMTGTPKGVGVVESDHEFTLCLFEQDQVMTHVRWNAC